MFRLLNKKGNTTQTLAMVTVVAIAGVLSTILKPYMPKAAGGFVIKFMNDNLMSINGAKPTPGDQKNEGARLSEKDKVNRSIVGRLKGADDYSDYYSYEAEKAVAGDLQEIIDTANAENLGKDYGDVAAKNVAAQKPTEPTDTGAQEFVDHAGTADADGNT